MNTILALKLGVTAAKRWRSILTFILVFIGFLITFPLMVLTIMLPSSPPLQANDYKSICKEGELNWVEVMVYDMGRTQNEFKDITKDDIFNSALEFYQLNIIKYVEVEYEREVTLKDKDGNEYTETETYHEWERASSNSYTGSSIRSAIGSFGYSASSFKQVFDAVEKINGHIEDTNGNRYKYETSLSKIEFPFVIEKLGDDMNQWILEVIESGMVQSMFGEEGELTPDEIQDILDKLPNTGVTRENIVVIAESLVGKITYLWGGKADPPTVPTALDCSGFTDYIFKLAGAGSIGAGTSHQWDNSYPISDSELKIGDLGFKKPPSQSSDSSPNHVGIFVGYNAKGEKMFVHCEGGNGSVKTTAERGSLYYFRRSLINFDE